eukprot:TRINITY_DN6303_c0_g1_i3.p1 TRINITY_DN6303_c0_g1~~TRINITY_DN6303_c0_g1_i3.p1  ORF type:complete len:348 (-),score=73.88 TRINITY_DN6303_c0_g1_i3:27-1070(-)
MEKIERAKKTLGTKNASEEDILEVLEDLDSIEVTIPILQETGIGKVVSAVKKNKNKQISAKALSIEEKWKQVVLQASSPKSSKKRKLDGKTKPAPKPSKKSKVSTERNGGNSNTSSRSSSGSLNNSSNSLRSSQNSNESNTDRNSLNNSLNTSNTRDSEGENSAKSSEVPPRKIVPSEALNGNTSDDARNKSQIMMAKALGERWDEEQLHPIHVAQAIEHELFRLYKDITHKDYRAKLRSLWSNIKDPKNVWLREELLYGRITAEMLCQMSYQELANPDLKNERKKIEEWHNEARTIGKQSGTCELFTCGKCKGNKTTYYQLQTRSADEPMTVFITCTICGNRWKQN